MVILDSLSTVLAIVPVVSCVLDCTVLVRSPKLSNIGFIQKYVSLCKIQKWELIGALVLDKDNILNLILDAKQNVPSPSVS
jgi:hypothetical protein